MKETRDHILAISSALFLQKNFKEVSMKEIVTMTGLSKGAFYHYFKSKEQIFLEVVESIFSSIIDIDCNRFAKGSLHEYYEEHLLHLDATYQLLLAKNIISPSFNLNYYSLLFDAMRFFPDFKQRMTAANAVERAVWLDVIHAARQNGEIRSTMSDDQITDIFIHTNSGVGMNNIMAGSSDDTVEGLRAIWDGFYTSMRP